jgi:hypothetical protein
MLAVGIAVLFCTTEHESGRHLLGIHVLSWLVAILCPAGVVLMVGAIHGWH